MQSDLYIVKHALILEQTDVLKCTRNTCLVDVDRFLSCDIRTIQLIVPSSGVYTPVSILNTVVLPAPFGPIRPYNCPFSMEI